MGFTSFRAKQGMRHINAILLALLLAPAVTAAADVAVVGLFANKAVVVVNGGKPRTLSVGEATPEGVRLISADSESATFEIDGKRETLRPGQHGAIASTAPAKDERKKVVLTADARGHFFTMGTVNGVSTRFMVDTGATTVAMSVQDAKRTGVDYLAGRKVPTQTANGVAAAYRVRLNSVAVGGITLNNVDAIVIDGNLPHALLGMSFLRRMERRTEGDTLTLIQRF